MPARASRAAAVASRATIRRPEKSGRTSAHSGLAALEQLIRQQLQGADIRGIGAGRACRLGCGIARQLDQRCPLLRLRPELVRSGFGLAQQPLRLAEIAARVIEAGAARLVRGARRLRLLERAIAERERRERLELALGYRALEQAQAASAADKARSASFNDAQLFLRGGAVLRARSKPSGRVRGSRSSGQR